jgi:hypothetical protein
LIVTGHSPQAFWDSISHTQSIPAQVQSKIFSIESMFGVDALPLAKAYQAIAIQRNMGRDLRFGNPQPAENLRFLQIPV